MVDFLYKCDPLFYLNGKIWLLKAQEMSVDLSAFAIRANKMLKQERYSEALKCYESMVDESPTDPNLHVDYADCLCLLDKYDEAVKKYLEAIKIDEKCLRGYVHYANLLCLMGNMELAQSNFAKVYQVTSPMGNESKISSSSMKKRTPHE